MMTRIVLLLACIAVLVTSVVCEEKDPSLIPNFGGLVGNVYDKLLNHRPSTGDSKDGGSSGGQFPVTETTDALKLLLDANSKILTKVLALLQTTGKPKTDAPSVTMSPTGMSMDSTSTSKPDEHMKQ